MELQAAKELALDLMEEHGLIPNWEFRFNNRATAWGQTQYFYVNWETGKVTPAVIFLSKKLTPHASEADVRDTILHEIAHALVGPSHNHDAVWSRKAREIGSNGIRATKNMPAPVRAELRAKPRNYKGICPYGHTTLRYRRTDKLACGRCCRER